MNTRREILKALTIAGSVTALHVPAWGQSASPHTKDWDWLAGNWDVWHRRLKERLAGSDDWAEFAGKSSFWHTLGGLGNVDDNLLYLPGGEYRGLSIRAFDPATRTWSIWWVDGRQAGKLDPPVVGDFKNDEGVFYGKDVFKGIPITVRFRWHEVRSKRPHWDQAFSKDDGKTWEINWRNYFTRTNAEVTTQPSRAAAGVPERDDWKFLAGSWQVLNRRLTQRLVGSKQWEKFPSTLRNWPVLGGFGNVGDNVFNAAAGTHKGMSVRTYDEGARLWRSWWLDGRDPANITPSLSGRFENGVGLLTGDDVQDGKPVKVRSRWSDITAKSARWEQAMSADGGATWETNWTADLTRVPA
ncbi:MAG: hypothetical protein ABI821_20055 [Pseudomonadota bacterium]